MPEIISDRTSTEKQDKTPRRRGSRFRHGGAVKDSNGKLPRFWQIWKGMRKRCTNPKCRAYHNYGGRGIKVIWQSYEAFRDDMWPTYRDDLTIERIDNDGNYCKENCRWATYAEQSANTRLNTKLTWNGKTQCLRAWEKETGIKFSVLQGRFHRDWPVEKILTHPVRRRKSVQVE